MPRYCILFFIISALFATSASFAQSVLANGDWYKFAIYKEGIYKLTASDLRNSGINISSIDPSKIRIFGNKGGMLPQKNSQPRPADLQENAIAVVGGEDGNFDEQDFILFFAHGADEYHYNANNDLFEYSKNKYDTTNFYFLTISAGPGKRITSQPDLAGNHFLIDTYTDFYFYEKEESNLLHSGREWWGRIPFNGLKSISLPFSNLDEEGKTRVYVEIMSQNTSPAKYIFRINDLEIGDLTTQTINYFNAPPYEYSVRGKEQQAIFDVQNSLLGDNELAFHLQFNKNSTSSSNSMSMGYYNKIIVQADRKLRYDGKPMFFHAPQALEQGLVTFQVDNASQGLHLWNVGEDYHPKSQVFSYQNSKISFGTVGGDVKKYSLFDPSTVPSPKFVGQVANQDLKSLTTPDLLIITHENFLNETLRLAEFRTSNDGYDVEVATTQEIFNEFSSGRQDITAIRDFIRTLYTKDSQKLKYVLLVGKGSYDYLGYERNNTNFIPIYQSYNSLHPIMSYSSDDYYGFMEEAEGEWLESETGDHTLDISVGRLPVINSNELHHIINKLISYSSSPEALGAWRRNMIFVADDEDLNEYQKQSEQLSIYADTTLNYFTFKKIFLGSYKQENSSTIEKSPEARKAVKEAVEKGALLVNYIGHGGPAQWADEEILTNEEASSFQNADRLPLFVTATCEFGRHDDPLYRSGGEQLVLNPNGGGIGLVTTSRPVYSSSNFEINKSFFNALRNNLAGGILGDIFKETKNNALAGTNNRNFILLGDPSMRLAIPTYSIELEHDFSDTLKARQEVVLKGNITDDLGNIQYDFNGIIDLTVFDKPIQISTREDAKNSPYIYKDRLSVIFRGKSSVENGSFETHFIVPQDIQHKTGEGKINFYAREDNGMRDAVLGKNIRVGGSAPQIRDDNEGPEIVAYLEDSTFRSGDLIGNNALLIAHFSDPSGINLSGRSFDGDITAILDDEVIILNDHYTTRLDDFTTGSVVYPLEGLSPGKHTLVLSASDVFNNVHSVQFDFVVSENEGLTIQELINVPNPMVSSTSFIFTHNRAGEPLEGTLTIFNNKGENILQLGFDTPAGKVRHKIFDWDSRNLNQSKISEGIYYYKIHIRSKLDGATAEKIQKLIIIN